MGTQKKIPKPNATAHNAIIDKPHVGIWMWILLSGLLLPPVGVTWLGNQIGGLPNQTTWVIILFIPTVFILLFLPKAYVLNNTNLSIVGLFYRIRVPIAGIKSVEKISAFTAFIHPGSIFCSDHKKALLIKRAGKLSFIISPNNPTPFLQLTKPDKDVIPGGEKS